MGRKLTIKVPALGESVSGILELPKDAFCLMVLAHGAGAGMQHTFMEKLADSLKASGIGTLRFNFVYMEKGGGRPDYPPKAHAVCRAAVDRAKDYAEKAGIPVVAAGKSFGGRMFSQMAAKGAPDISALVYYGFPLHAPGKDGTERAAHLKDVKAPMLFLQGSRDALAREDLIREVSKGLRHATLQVLEGADHSFKVLKSVGMTHDEVIADLAMRSAGWLRKKLL